MQPFEIRQVLNDLLVMPTQKTFGVDALMLELKNFRNVHNLEAYQLLGNSVIVLLDRCNLTRNIPEDWPKVIGNVFRPYLPVWQYYQTIADDEARSECIFQVFEYCQNPKRPHLGPGFYYIIGSLLAGGIICPVSALQFVEAMELSEEEEERKAGKKLLPLLSRSWP